jgi:hypothetical protein
MLGHIAFMGFVTMWTLAGRSRWSTQTRYFLGGITGGTALLFDYSGIIFLLGLFFYGIAKRWQAAKSLNDTIRHSAWYIMGTIGPVALLWFYQWQSFGNPFLPGQHWMPPVEWIELGYQGYSLPQIEILTILALDYRFGLFVVSPLMFLALLAPLLDKGKVRRLPSLELTFLLILFLALWVFFAGSNYTRLQFNTGIRYLAPIFPFLFVPAAVALAKLPRWLIFATTVLSFVISWPLAMYRDVESGLGILNPIIRTFVNGFQLPIMATLSQIDAQQYGLPIGEDTSPVALLLLVAVILYGVWSPQWSGVLGVAGRDLAKEHKAL